MSANLPLPDFRHERVETLTGRRSGLFIAVALHSSVLGSALGGARLWTYPHWSDGLGDALRLSAAMTLKNAAAGLDAGGGKSVIALPPGTELDAERRRAAFLDLGDGTVLALPTEGGPPAPPAAPDRAKPKTLSSNPSPKVFGSCVA